MNEYDEVAEREYRFHKMQEAYEFIDGKLVYDEVQAACVKSLSDYRDMDFTMLRDTGVFYAENKRELEFITSFEEEYQYYLGFSGSALRYENRYVFPIKNGKGNLISWIGYDWESTSKYLVGMLGLGDKKRVLFGMDYMYEAFREDTVIVHEGIFDTLRLREIGLMNGVSLLGKRMSDWQKRYINRFKNKILIPDGDESGQSMIEQWKRGLTGNVAVVKLGMREKDMVYPEGVVKVLANDTDALLRGEDPEKERFKEMYYNLKKDMLGMREIEVTF